MNEVRIYLSGGMTGMSLVDQTEWRNRIKDALKFQYAPSKPFTVFSPPDYYSVFTNAHTCEREAMEFDLAMLRKSDVVVVNFNNPSSIGTAMELAIAKEYRIPVIGFGDSKSLHPWLLECCTRMCSGLKGAVEHLVEFYLN